MDGKLYLKPTLINPLSGKLRQYVTVTPPRMTMNGKQNCRLTYIVNIRQRIVDINCSVVGSAI